MMKETEIILGIVLPNSNDILNRGILVIIDQNNINSKKIKCWVNDYLVF